MGKLAIAKIVKLLTPSWNRVPEDEETLLPANDTGDQLAKKFLQSLPDDFDRIEKAAVALRSKPKDSTCNTELLGLVQDLANRALNFDYHLISVFGTDLCQFLKGPTVFTLRGQKVIRLYIDAIKQVADKNITGEGHAVGLRVMENLQGMMRMILLGKIRYH